MVVVILPFEKDVPDKHKLPRLVTGFYHSPIIHCVFHTVKQLPAIR